MGAASCFHRSGTSRKACGRNTAQGTSQSTSRAQNNTSGTVSYPGGTRLFRNLMMCSLTK